MKRIIAVILTMAVLLGCTAVLAEEKEWTCPECGALCTTNFCMQCGAKRPETIVCPDCGKEYPADISASFCGECGGKLKQDAVPTGRLEGNGFDTPEEAVTCYLEGLRNQDFRQMLSAFAWETQAEHYSTESQIKRIRMYNISVKPRFPNASSFLEGANLYSMLSSQTDAICQSIDTYVLGEDGDNPGYDPTMVIPLQEDTEVDTFMERFRSGKLEKLAGLTNIRFLTPDQVTRGLFSNERNQENYIKQNARYGADETVDIPAIADFDGDKILFCCPTVARYGSKWYLVSVSSMTSMIRGISVNMQAFVCVDKTVFEQEFLEQ